MKLRPFHMRMIALFIGIIITIIWTLVAKYKPVARNGSLFDMPRPLVLQALLLTALSGAIVIAFLALRRRWSWRRLLLVGIAWLTLGQALSTSAISIANGIFDESQPQRFSASIVRLEVHPKYNTRYRVYVRDWRPPHGEVPVEYQTMWSVDKDPDRTMLIVTKQGRLGYEWVVGVKAE